jgi:hypothetical protein
MVRYGQAVPPENDLTLIKGVNIAVVSGQSDILSNVEDTRLTRDMLKAGGSLVYYEEHPLGHLSFFTAENMDYFKVDVMKLMLKYHPLNQKKTFLD